MDPQNLKAHSVYALRDETIGEEINKWLTNAPNIEEVISIQVYATQGDEIIEGALILYMTKE